MLTIIYYVSYCVSDRLIQKINVICVLSKVNNWFVLFRYLFTTKTYFDLVLHHAYISLFHLVVKLTKSLKFA